MDPPSGSVTITEPPADCTRRGWGTYVFAAQPQRALSLSAPHLFDDAETEVEAVEAFLALGARILLIAGTDRDQNTAKAPCAQPSRPFLEADVSHTAESVFQIGLRRNLLERHVRRGTSSSTGTPILRVGCQDMDVFLSNGVEARRPTHLATLYALAANIAEESQARAAGGPVLKVDVYDDARTTASFGDGQHADEVCLGPAAREHLREGNDPEEPSRFIHVEQSRDARRALPPTEPRDPGRNRNVVMEGILKTFP